MNLYLILRSTLTAIADAIREKTGETGDMSPLDMPEKIRSIQTGGGDPYEIFKAVNANTITDFPALDGVTRIRDYMFTSNSELKKFDFSNITAIYSAAFLNSGLANDVTLPKSVTLTGPSIFRGCKFRSITFRGGVSRIDQGCFEWCENLEIIDARYTTTLTIHATSFFYTNKLLTLILRQNSVIGINGAFPASCGLSTANARFYVPSDLVDSYKTRWNRYLDKIVPIEGSIYETQYADGTPIT